MQSGDLRLQFDNVDFLSQIYLQQNQAADAIYYLKTAEEIIDRGSSFNLELIKIYSRFSQLYNQTKNYEKAAFYQQKYIDLKDKVYNEELTINLMKLEAEYQEKENKARIASQDQILALKENIIHGQNLLKVVIAGVVLVLLLVAVILIKSIRQRQKINKILDEKVKERTKAIEQSYEALLRANKEREILLQRTSNDLNSSLATINGLCMVGLQDVTDPHARNCISKVNETSSGLTITVKNLQPVNLSQ